MATTTFILDVRSVKERVLKLFRKGGIPQGYEFADTEIALKTIPPRRMMWLRSTGIKYAVYFHAKPGVRYHILEWTLALLMTNLRSVLCCDRRND